MSNRPNDQDRYEYEVGRWMDPEVLAKMDAYDALVARRSVVIHSDWDWSDRVAAITDDCGPLGKLLAAISASYNDLPADVRDAFDLVEEQIDHAADAVAECQLKNEREAL